MILTVVNKTLRFFFVLFAFHSSQTFVDLRANDFTGEIPSEIGELTKLKSLRLQANELIGDMPPEICALTDGILEELVADCDSEDPFSKVTCDINACCTECY